MNIKNSARKKWRRRERSVDELRRRRGLVYPEGLNTFESTTIPLVTNCPEEQQTAQNYQSYILLYSTVSYYVR